MRVVSWNVNGIRAGVRHGFVDFVDRSGADIVGVQEVRAQPEDIPPAARRPPGWHTAFTVAERRGYSGVGLYSVLAPFAVGDVDVSPCKKGRLRLSFGHRRHFGL